MDNNKITLHLSHNDNIYKTNYARGNNQIKLLYSTKSFTFNYIKLY